MMRWELGESESEQEQEKGTAHFNDTVDCIALLTNTFSCIHATLITHSLKTSHNHILTYHRVSYILVYQASS